MSFAQAKGRARVSTRAPRAFGVCDDCGEWYNLRDLRPQLEYFGPVLRENGFLVCNHCYDTPNDQARPIRLPPDPIPVKQPRVENFNSDYGLQGFQQFTLFVDPTVAALASKAQVLAAAAAASGIATPSPLTDYSGSVSQQNVSQQIVPVNGGRSWLLIYNLGQPQLQLSLGVATWGGLTNLILGPGEAILASGTGSVPTGQMTGIGLIPSVPYYAWDFR